MGLRKVGDEFFFHSCQKILGWEVLLRTLEDAFTNFILKFYFPSIYEHDASLILHTFPVLPKMVRKYKKNGCALL